MERHWTALAIIPYTFGKYQVPLERGAMEPRGVMVTIKGGGELLLDNERCIPDGRYEARRGPRARS
jgi:hypothetical protein